MFRNPYSFNSEIKYFSPDDPKYPPVDSEDYKMVPRHVLQRSNSFAMIYGMPHVVDQKGVGGGSFGDVQPLTDPYGKKQYAVKKLKNATEEEAKREAELIKEAMGISLLIKSKHGYKILMPYYDAKPLRGFPVHVFDAKTIFPCVRIFFDRIDALHIKKIAHLDLHSNNVLIDEKMNPYICDLNLSRRFGEKNTVNWAARCSQVPPESVYDEGSTTAAADVYAAGQLFAPQQVWGLAFQAISPNLFLAIQNLRRMMTHFIPNHRITLAQAKTYLKILESHLELFYILDKKDIAEFKTYLATAKPNLDIIVNLVIESNVTPDFLEKILNELKDKKIDFNYLNIDGEDSMISLIRKGNLAIINTFWRHIGKDLNTVLDKSMQHVKKSLNFSYVFQMKLSNVLDKFPGYEYKNQGFLPKDTLILAISNHLRHNLEVCNNYLSLLIFTYSGDLAFTRPFATFIQKIIVDALESWARKGLLRFWALFFSLLDKKKINDFLDLHLKLKTNVIRPHSTDILNLLFYYGLYDYIPDSEFANPSRAEYLNRGMLTLFKKNFNIFFTKIKKIAEKDFAICLRSLKSLAEQKIAIDYFKTHSKENLNLIDVIFEGFYNLNETEDKLSEYFNLLLEIMPTVAIVNLINKKSPAYEGYTFFMALARGGYFNVTKTLVKYMETHTTDKQYLLRLRSLQLTCGLEEYVDILKDDQLMQFKKINSVITHTPGLIDVPSQSNCVLRKLIIEKYSTALRNNQMEIVQALVDNFSAVLFPSTPSDFKVMPSVVSNSPPKPKLPTATTLPTQFPIHQACERKPYPLVGEIDQLLSSGWDPNLYNLQGEHAFYALTSSKKSIAVLTSIMAKHAAKINYNLRWHQTIIDQTLLGWIIASPKIPEENRQKMIHHIFITAIDRGDADLIKGLLSSKRADPYLLYKGISAFDYANKKNKDLARLIISLRPQVLQPTASLPLQTVPPRILPPSPLLPAQTGLRFFQPPPPLPPLTYSFPLAPSLPVQTTSASGLFQPPSQPQPQKNKKKREREDKAVSPRIKIKNS